MPTQTFLDLSEPKRKRILNAALKEFTDTPYEKVSIHAIIQAAQIPRGSFYQYFADKEDLFIYCMTQTQQKVLENIFDDNLNYYWHRIYSQDSMQDIYSPWYCLIDEKMKTLLDDAEYRFYTSFYNNRIPLSHNILRTSYCVNATSNYYPYFIKKLEQEGSIPDPKNRDILAFFLSMTDLLCHEYAYANNTSYQEAFSSIHLALQTLSNDYRAGVLPVFPADIEIQENIFPRIHAKLNSLKLTSLHLLSKNGTDIFIPVLSDIPWELSQAAGEDTSSLRITVVPETMEGSMLLPLKSTAQPLHSPDESVVGLLSFTFTGNGNCPLNCTLLFNGISYRLDAPDLIGIGTDTDGEKICLIENGRFVL